MLKVSSYRTCSSIIFANSLCFSESGSQSPEGFVGRLGILNLRNVIPGELSGGEQRRMAVTRALAGSPDFVFADEPTTDLDDENTVLVLTLLREAAPNGASVFVVTHEKDAAANADRLLRMDAGVLSPV